MSDKLLGIHVGEYYLGFSKRKKKRSRSVYKKGGSRRSKK